MSGERRVNEQVAISSRALKSLSVVIVALSPRLPPPVVAVDNASPVLVLVVAGAAGECSKSIRERDQ